MSTNLRKRNIVIIAVVIAVLVTMVSMPTNPQPTPVAEAQGPTVVTWFVGLGAGGDPPQVEAQNRIVEEFNATHDDIQLEIVIADNTVAYDTLNTLIASGDSPDIVGPVGIRGANSFEGNWLDIEPLVEASGYDLTQFPEALVDFYRINGQLVGLPFGQFPSFMYFNRDLFDAAALPYPPQEYGEPYADGDTWDFDKVQELSMLLTLDANGNNAFSPDFDADNIVQFGFFFQFTDARGMATSFGSGSFVDENGDAVMPEHWAEFYKWYYDAMWTYHFIPNAAYANSDLLGNGNPFNSGNVAMALTHLWYGPCCLQNVQNWDLAVQPEYNGEVTAKLHADTFRILDTSANPEAAFEVLTYLVGDASSELLSVYGGVPARPEQQDAFFAGLDETFTQGVNWQVAIDSLEYPDNPNHEGYMPNFQKADELIGTFRSLIDNDSTLDIDAEMDKFITDLQAVFDEVDE